MNYLLAEKTWPEVQRAVEAKTVLLLPFAATEEHGRHLQIGTDTIIGEQVAMAVAGKINPEVPALVMPSIAYGYVPRITKQFPGTFCVRWNVMIDYLADVCTSAIEMGFRKLVIISAHGPHGDISRLAAREVFDRTGVGVVVTQPHTMVVPTLKKVRKSKLGGASHACEYETSLMLHYGYPVDLTGLDDRDAIKACNEWIAGDLCGSGKVNWSTWALQETETGAFGDPSCASAETGRLCMEAVVDEYCRFLRYFWAQDLPPRHL